MVVLCSKGQLVKALGMLKLHVTLPCHLQHVNDMWNGVDNVPEYRDPQAHSASEHNISFLPVAKHMPLFLFSGDL